MTNMMTKMKIAKHDPPAIINIKGNDSETNVTLLDVLFKTIKNK